MIYPSPSDINIHHLLKVVSTSFSTTKLLSSPL